MFTGNVNKISEVFKKLDTYCKKTNIPLGNRTLLWRTKVDIRKAVCRRNHWLTSAGEPWSGRQGRLKAAGGLDSFTGGGAEELGRER